MVCECVLCSEANSAEVRTLCMGAPGGLYRPTPRGYNGNPAGLWPQPSVSTPAGFSAGCWVPPAAGDLVDRPAPPPRVLSAAAYCSLIPDDEGFVEVSVATVCRLEGSHCSLTSSCLLNEAHVSREGSSQLLGAGHAPSRLGEAGPPSSVSLAKGARRPRAVRESVVGDVEASMATVPSRKGDGRPVRPPVAMPASGFGGSGPHCGHTPSCRRYVG